MMYSEFVKAVGCKQTDYNYKVFLDLEAMYMNTDLSKEDIYTYGKKLVDNSKTEAELELEAEIKAEIETAKADAKRYTDTAKMYDAWAKTEFNEQFAKDWKHQAKLYREYATAERNKVKELKYILNS